MSNSRQARQVCNAWMLQPLPNRWRAPGLPQSQHSMLTRRPALCPITRLERIAPPTCAKRLACASFSRTSMVFSWICGVVVVVGGAGSSR